MKRTIKIFVSGFITACLLITPLSAFGGTLQVALNTVNINVNGIQVVTKGQSYMLANGTILPYSLNYNGTVYLPIRKVSEIMGKDIGYDAKSSTASISDRISAVPVVPAAETPTKNTDKDTDTEKDNDNDNKNDSDSDIDETETGFAVINSFTDTKSGSKWVNRAKGFMDGDSLDMRTSKADLMEFDETPPAVYEITYIDNIITDLEKVSLDEEDMLKSNEAGGRLEGYKDSYRLSANAIIYRMERTEDGNFNGYSKSEAGSLHVGDKVYLYDIGGKSGYDIVIEEDSWI